MVQGHGQELTNRWLRGPYGLWSVTTTTTMMRRRRRRSSGPVDSELDGLPAVMKSVVQTWPKTWFATEIYFSVVV